VRTVTVEGNVELLGDVGYLTYPIYLEAMPLDLKFHDIRGALVGELKREGTCVDYMASTSDGDVVLIVSPKGEASERRFLWVSSKAAVLQEFPVRGCAGPFAMWYLIVSNGRAVFSFAQGATDPVLAPGRRMLCVVTKGEEPTVVEIPEKCGTRPVWFGVDGVALLGTEDVPIWDLRQGKWRETSLRFSKYTAFGACEFVDGLAVTLIYKDKEKQWCIEVLDVPENKVIATVPIGADVRFAAKPIQRTDKGLFVVTDRVLFAVHPERWKKAAN
jgi:hypothetical protein